MQKVNDKASFKFFGVFFFDKYDGKKMYVNDLFWNMKDD